MFFIVIIAQFAAKSACAEVLDDPSIIRLHIIANSDLAEDQNVKLLVRDAVREHFSDLTADAESADAAYSAAASALDSLEALASSVLIQNGFDYGARAEIGTFEFPDKVYGGVLVPAGRYRAVRIVLGAGEGHNWWCVLYPDLCFVDAACRSEAQKDKPIVFYSSIGRWLEQTINRGDER